MRLGEHLAGITLAICCYMKTFNDKADLVSLFQLFEWVLQLNKHDICFVYKIVICNKAYKAFYIS